MISELKIRRVGIDTYRENIVYMPVGCEICKSQGFHALSKLEIHHGKKSILATLNMTENALIGHGEIGLSNVAFRRLGAAEGAAVTLSHPNPLLSTDFIRHKLDGRPLSKKEILAIVQDIAAYRYSNIELTAFVVACSKRNLSENEIVSLTEAMVETGEKIFWNLPLVLDKHCIGGIPGNRTSMIIVPIIAAFGLPMPKTSSRAITSPAGTADTMEALTNVQLSLAQMKKIVQEEKGCIAWGGSLSLAPVDDIIISVERPLNLDSEGQMIASILSKKKAAGSTHVLIDIPVGPTTKVRSMSEANRLKKSFEKVGKKIGLRVLVLNTDGTQPVGQGIGPVLEAMDVLKVLKGDSDAPEDLKEKSVFLAGKLLEMCAKVKTGHGSRIAREILESGSAYEKFLKIASRQGTLKKLELAPYSYEVKSGTSGRIRAIHNRKIAKVAKLAGAPADPRAGVFLQAKIGDSVKKGAVLFRIFAENREELQFATDYVEMNKDIFTLK
jgi:thymidine phosphorylase